MTRDYDLIVVGSGVAGLYGALCAAAEARVLIDARDYSVIEFAVQGSFLKSSYSMSYKQLRHVIGATLPADAFTVPPQPGEIVVTGEGTAVPAHDVMVLALRALAQSKQTR